MTRSSFEVEKPDNGRPRGRHTRTRTPRGPEDADGFRTTATRLESLRNDEPNNRSSTATILDAKVPRARKEPRHAETDKGWGLGTTGCYRLNATARRMAVKRRGGVNCDTLTRARKRVLTTLRRAPLRNPKAICKLRSDMAGSEVPHTIRTCDDETSECAVSEFWFAGKPECRRDGPPLPIKRARREGREERRCAGRIGTGMSMEIGGEAGLEGARVCLDRSVSWPCGSSHWSDNE